MSGNIWPTNYFTQKTEKTDNTEKTEDEEKTDNNEKTEDEEEPELISKEDIIDSLPEAEAEAVEAPDENTETTLSDVDEKDEDKESEKEEDTEEEDDNDEEDEIRDSENDDFEADNTHRLTSAFDSGISTSDLFLSSYKVNRALETYIVSINTKPIYYNNDPNSAKKLMWGVVKSFVRNLTLNHLNTMSVLLLYPITR